MNSQQPQSLPDYDPQLLQRQIGINNEMRRRNMISEEEYQRRNQFIHQQDQRKRAEFIEAGYQMLDIPKMEREFHETMTRQQRNNAAKSNHWLYAWNLEPKDDPFDFAVWWEDDTEKKRAKQRKQATPEVERVNEDDREQLRWLWPQRLPLGKVSLLTGDACEGKTLIALEITARVTAGRDWPDGSPGCGPAEVLFITPDARSLDVTFPRLTAAGVDLSRLRMFSSVTWNDPKTGESNWETFQLPIDGPLFEKFLEQSPNLRLIVIDPLSTFLSLPSAAAERESALHDILSDLESLAEMHQLAIVCVESARSGGLIKTAARRQWRAHYDAVFQTVWGVARDPRKRGRRLLLPIRHHLGDDRNGLQFEIQSTNFGPANIAWGEAEDSVTYAEATGRVRLGRGIWSFSQTADAEAWLRRFLREGEQPSLEIFNEARKQGFTENPVRTALRRVASKRKQGNAGGWFWKLKET